MPAAGSRTWGFTGRRQRKADVLVHQPDVEPCVVGQIEDEWGARA